MSSHPRGRLSSRAVATASAWGVQHGLGALAEGPARRIGRSIGSLSYRALRIRRPIVEQQIAASFPEAEPRWIRSTARGCYRHFGEELAMLAGGAPRIRQVLSRVDDVASGARQLEAAVESRGGAILVTGHLGNWELAGAVIAAFGLPTTAVAKRQRGGADRRIHELRTSLGVQIVYRDEDPRSLVRSLREGRVLALVADQHDRRSGARLDFLGRPAWTSLGPARLCLSANVPLFFGGLVRDGQGYQTVLEEVPLPEGGGSEPRMVLTRGWLDALERAIRARPEQYFWFHRRWKGGGRPQAPRPEHRVGNASTQTTVEEGMEAH